MNNQFNEEVSSILKPRKQEANKGNYGHAIIVAGSKGKMGAAVIAAKACLRSGVGLLTVNVPTEERHILQIAVPEAMLAMREDQSDFSSFSSACIGPGLGINENAKEIVSYFLTHFNKPLLIDADALNLIALNNLFDKIKVGSVLTPHPIEFDRLFGTHNSHEERMNKAIEIARLHAVAIVLKGHHTLVTYGGEVFINKTGNAGLAKGGSGDALSGIITSFLAQGYSSFQAAKLGVYLHGLAADITLNKQSMESMLITDVIDQLGNAFKQISK